MRDMLILEACLVREFILRNIRQKVISMCMVLAEVPAVPFIKTDHVIFATGIVYPR